MRRNRSLPFPRRPDESAGYCKGGGTRIALGVARTCEETFVLHAGELVDSPLVGHFLFITGLDSIGVTLGAIEIIIGFHDVEIERDGEVHVGLAAREYPADDRRFVDFERFAQGDQLAGRRRKLRAHSFRQNEIVLNVVGRLLVPNRADNIDARVVRASLRRMVLTARLEVDVFARPSHRPVDSPEQLHAAFFFAIDAEVLLAKLAAILKRRWRGMAR